MNEWIPKHQPPVIILNQISPYHPVLFLMREMWASIWNWVNGRSVRLVWSLLGSRVDYFINYTLQPFKAYCVIWVRHSSFHHQASPRVTTQEHPAAKGGTVGEKCPGILPKCRLPHYIYRSFTCRKATTWDRWLYFPSEGRHAEDFFALKIRRLLPVANLWTWVPKASTLPLDHRSRLVGWIDVW